MYLCWSSLQQCCRYRAACDFPLLLLHIYRLFICLEIRNNLPRYKVVFSKNLSRFYFPQWLFLICQWNTRCNDAISINLSINSIIDYFNRLIVAALLMTIRRGEVARHITSAVRISKSTRKRRFRLFLCDPPTCWQHYASRFLSVSVCLSASPRGFVLRAWNWIMKVQRNFRFDANFEKVLHATRNAWCQCSDQ